MPKKGDVDVSSLSDTKIIREARCYCSRFPSSVNAAADYYCRHSTVLHVVCITRLHTLVLFTHSHILLLSVVVVHSQQLASEGVVDPALVF